MSDYRLKNAAKYVIIRLQQGRISMRRFKGFTVAELMVALAVVGIIVAVVTPAIVRTRPDKNKMMVKKTFYTTEHIVSALMNDERLYPDKTDYCYLEDGNPEKRNCSWGFDDTTKVNYEGNDYEGDTKFAMLFRNKLNVKTVYDDDGLKFSTSDGAYWDLSDTKGAWESGKSRVGGFGDQDETKDDAGNVTKGKGAGVGTILIDVNGADGPGGLSKDYGTDFDHYRIEILANGKLRINPEDSIAAEYVTINTSITN